MPGLHVVRRAGPAGELLVAEETLQLLLAQAHHAAHPRAPLLARPRLPGPFTKHQSHSIRFCFTLKLQFIHYNILNLH